MPMEPATSGGIQQPLPASHSDATANFVEIEASGEVAGSAFGRLAIRGARSAACFIAAYWASSMVGRTAASLTCPGLTKVASNASICSGVRSTAAFTLNRMVGRIFLLISWAGAREIRLTAHTDSAATNANFFIILASQKTLVFFRLCCSAHAEGSVFRMGQTVVVGPTELDHPNAVADWFFPNDFLARAHPCRGIHRGNPAPGLNSWKSWSKI